MKTLLSLTIICIIIITLFSFSSHKPKVRNGGTAELKDTSANYIDGVYLGQSQAIYTGEPFWGHAQVTVENGAFTNIHFTIRDSSLRENVDSMYGVIHYKGNPGYMQQCVNDGHGIEIYPQKLIESQDLDDVDAISGATWSYRIFIASVDNALKDAKKPTATSNINETDEILVKVMPNPFHSTLTIEYNLLKNCFVNLSLYDVQGKLIKQFTYQEQLSGTYSIQWNECSPAGIYYYRLQTENTVLAGKLIKTKE